MIPRYRIVITLKWSLNNKEQLKIEKLFDIPCKYSSSCVMRTQDEAGYDVVNALEMAIAGITCLKLK